MNDSHSAGLQDKAVTGNVVDDSKWYYRQLAKMQLDLGVKTG